MCVTWLKGNVPLKTNKVSDINLKPVKKRSYVP